MQLIRQPPISLLNLSFPFSRTMNIGLVLHFLLEEVSPFLKSIYISRLNETELPVNLFESVKVPVILDSKMREETGSSFLHIIFVNNVENLM